MWWPRNHIAALAVLAAVVGPALAGCGYRPLYGDGSAALDGPVAAQLAGTQVSVIANRSGQTLRNYLIENLNPSGRPADPAYVLRVSLSEVPVELGIQKSDTATRANLIVTAYYGLDTAAGAPVTSGTVRTITSYNILLDEFATLSAERDARDRAIRQISEDIRTRLALHFNRQD